VPRDSLLQHHLVQGSGPGSAWSNQELSTLRRAFWASREVVLLSVITQFDGLLIEFDDGL
jgi:hypothetical protein